MEFDLSGLLTSFGIYSITLSQILMIGVGFILLFLAIHNKFEPLLLLPIGFGAILTNIPEIGLSYSGLEKLILVNDQLEIEGLLALLGLSEINLYSISDLTSHQLFMGENFAYDQGYRSGILYKFYQVSIGSGIAPLLIFMGVGAMTDFGPMLANPKTLILGAAAQFGIFATVIGALFLNNFDTFSLPLNKLLQLESLVVPMALQPYMLHQF